MLNQFVLILKFQVRLGGKANEVLVGPVAKVGMSGVLGGHHQSIRVKDKINSDQQPTTNDVSMCHDP